MTDELQKKVFSQNLRRYLDLSMSTQKEIAAKMGVSPQTFNTWCTGVALPRMGKIQQLADLFGIEKSDLIDIKERTKLPSIKGLKIPVLGRVAAGLPIEAQENIIDWEEIPEEWQKKGEYFALEIKGDSMEPRMYEGDVVIVKKQSEAENGQVCIVTINGDDATCKRLMVHSSSIALISFNPKYAPMVFAAEEAQKLPITVWGVVVEIRGKMKWV